MSNNDLRDLIEAQIKKTHGRLQQLILKAPLSWEASDDQRLPPLHYPHFQFRIADKTVIGSVSIMRQVLAPLTMLEMLDKDNLQLCFDIIEKTQGELDIDRPVNPINCLAGCINKMQVAGILTYENLAALRSSPDVVVFCALHLPAIRPTYLTQVNFDLLRQAGVIHQLRESMGILTFNALSTPTEHIALQDIAEDSQCLTIELSRMVTHQYSNLGGCCSVM